MRWDKENKEKLYLLLKDAGTLKGFGIKRSERPMPAPVCPGHVVIPDPRNSNNMSMIIRDYLCIYDKLGGVKLIADKIRNAYGMEAKPSLVSTVRMYYKDRRRKISFLKIPKDVAEKFLILGVP